MPGSACCAGRVFYHGNFFRVRCHPVPDQETVCEKLPCTKQVLEHLIYLDHADESRRHPDHGENFLRGGTGEDTAQARGLSRENGRCLTVEPPYRAVEERDLFFLCDIVEQVPGGIVVHRIDNTISPAH